MPTIGALGLLTALAPTPVVPNGTAESGGGVVAGAAGAAIPSAASAASSEQRRQAAARPQAHPVHWLTASMSMRSRA